MNVTAHRTTVTCDPYDTLARAGQGPWHGVTEVSTPEAEDAAADAQQQLADDYGDLWERTAAAAAAERGYTAETVATERGDVLATMTSTYRDGADPDYDESVEQEVWQAAHDRIGVGVVEGRWQVWV